MNNNKSIDPTHNHIAGLYDLEKTIGQGHFAIVKSARHIFSGERVAIKIIDKLKLDRVSQEHLFQEVKCMKLVQHPNVVRLYEVVDTPSKLYLILEFGDGGDMYDYIMKHSNGLSESRAKVYFKQIVKAIKYCHDLRVVHRDLKPENVVFFQQTGQVKLTDFGFSNVFEPENKLLTSCGSLAYSAPEILLGDSYYAPPVDVWSLGVILYMLVTGRAPFQEASDSETLTMILDCKYYLPEYLSSECSDLISRMIVREPVKRIKLDVIYKHEWLNSKCAKSSINNLSSCEEFSDLDDFGLVSKRNSINEDTDLPLVRRELISQKDNDDIIKTMIEGKIATREEIQQALDQDEYNYITATYYLLAERLIKKEYLLNKKKKIKTTNSRKILNEITTLQNQQSNNNPAPSSSVLSKNAFNSNILKMQQRNLLLRQAEAREEDEDEEQNQEINTKNEEKLEYEKLEEKIETPTNAPTTLLTNIIEDEDEEEEEEEIVNNNNCNNNLNCNLNKPTTTTTIPNTSLTSTRRSSRGAILSQTGENQIAKLTIPEEDIEHEIEDINENNTLNLNQRQQLSPSVIQSLRDEAYLKLTPSTLNEQKQPISLSLDEAHNNIEETPHQSLLPKKSHSFKSSSHDQDAYDPLNNQLNTNLIGKTRYRNGSRVSSSGADTSDSDNELNKKQDNLILGREYDWNRSASSSSRSRNKLRSNQFNRPLSMSSEMNQSKEDPQLSTPNNPNNPVTSPSSKTLSVEHRLANMSQMSISSQLSKNNSFRYHRSTLTGTETPNQLYNQQISSTTPTPRESIVFNRGDEKPIAKILLQQHQQNQSFRIAHDSIAESANSPKSKSFDLSTGTGYSISDSKLSKLNNSLIQAKIESFNTVLENGTFLRQNNDSYSKAIKQSVDTPIRAFESGDNMDSKKELNQRLNFNTTDYDVVCDKETNEPRKENRKASLNSSLGKKHSTTNSTTSLTNNNNNNNISVSKKNSNKNKSDSSNCSKCCTLL